MNLSGQDQKGIVKNVFEIFQKYGVNVEELETSIRGAPWSGHALFEAKATLSSAPDLDFSPILEDLESISNDLLVDIDWIGP